MNIYDIATKANVSIATVSRVINQKGNVSPKTQAKVLQVIEELGYTPNIFARGLGLDTVHMIGVMCANVDDIYYAKAVATIENSLRKFGYDVILYCTGNALEDKQKYMKLLLSKKVDAVILIGSIFKENDDNLYIQQATSQVPVLLINGLLDFENTYCFVCDDYVGLLDATTIAIARGHSQLLYLYDQETSSGVSKLNGFKTALKKANIPEDRCIIVKTEHYLTAARATISSLLEQGRNFSAIFTSNDLLATGALQAVLHHGLQVPSDVAIIGFDNSVLSECTYPSLSTIDSKVELLCSITVDSLIKLLQGKDISKKITVSPELIFRQTF